MIKMNKQKLKTIKLDFSNHCPIEYNSQAQDLLNDGYELITIYAADKLYAVFGKTEENSQPDLL